MRSTGQSTQQSDPDATPLLRPNRTHRHTPAPHSLSPAESDGAALTALFDATGGESWQNNDGWLYTEDLGQWHGVTTDATDAAGRVTELNLRDNGLSGELPEELGYLSGLTELDLRDNQLGGALPPELGSLTGLEELYLSSNRFTGALPASLVALTGLTDLWIHDNQFGAEFPPGAWPPSPDWKARPSGKTSPLGRKAAPPGLLADLVALVALYESAGGESWAERDNWLSDPAVAALGAASPSAATGRVTGLDLSENGLSGELPRPWAAWAA